MATGDYRQSWERVPEGPKPEGPPEYTPTTEEVREAWECAMWEGATSRESRAGWDRSDVQFPYQQIDRWLASVRADAWDEGNQAGWDENDFGDTRNPYRSEKQ